MSLPLVSNGLQAAVGKPALAITMLGSCPGRNMLPNRLHEQRDSLGQMLMRILAAQAPQPGKLSCGKLAN